MKRFVFFFAFTCMALCILGETPSNQSVTGSRIAKMDTYDFTWDDENAVANVIADSKTLTGKHCKIEVILGSYYLVNFYGDYKIPIIINEETGEVKIECGIALASLSNYEVVGGNGNEYQPSLSFSRIEDISYINNERVTLQATFTPTHWTLYAMPLSWLEGGDSADYICGTISGDSISFSDDFGFLVKKDVEPWFGEPRTTWGLSPIMKNVTFYRPNGLHTCVEHYMCTIEPPQPTGTYVIPGPHWEGTDGVVYRPIDPRPGSTKPVKPRRFNQTISLVNQDQSNTTFYSKIEVDNTAEEESQLTSQSSNGTPESYEIYIEQINDTTLRVFNLFGKDYGWNYLYINPNGTISFPKQVICANRFLLPGLLYNCSGNSSQASALTWGNEGVCSPEFIYWGDTYLCNNDKIARGYYGENEIWFDGFTLNVQDFVCTVPESLRVVGHVTSASVYWVDTDDTTWNLRYRLAENDSDDNICGDMEALDDETDDDFAKEDNYDGIWIVPSDNNDEKVKRRPLSLIYQRILNDVFDANVQQGYVATPEWTYISNLTETSCRIEGLQPGTTYEVQVQAVFNGYTGVWTSPIYFLTLPMLGDVNKDDAIGIADVTTLIDALLNEDQNTRSTAFDSGDVDEDGMITIADVTILLDYLLSDAK